MSRLNLREIEQVYRNGGERLDEGNVHWAKVSVDVEIDFAVQGAWDWMGEGV